MSIKSQKAIVCSEKSSKKLDLYTAVPPIKVLAFDQQQSKSLVFNSISYSGFLLGDGALFKNSGGPPLVKKGGGGILKVVDTIHWLVPGSRTPVSCASTTFAIYYATALWCD